MFLASSVMKYLKTASNHYGHSLNCIDVYSPRVTEKINRSQFIHRPEDGGSTHLWNVGILPDYTALYPRRLPSPYLPLWQPKISLSIFYFIIITILSPPLLVLMHRLSSYYFLFEDFKAYSNESSKLRNAYGWLTCICIRLVKSKNAHDWLTSKMHRVG
jgi:hypothetical protein